MATNTLSSRAVLVGCASLLAALVAQPGVALAQKISSQKGLTTAQFAFTQPLEFDQFDPALGVLESVNLLVEGTFTIASFSSVDGFTFNGAVHGAGPGGLGDNTSAFFLGSQQSSGTNFILPLNEVNGSPSTISTNMGAYVGLGTFDITMTGDYSVQPFGNQFFLFQPGATDATVTLTYNFTPVPEPTTIVLACVGFLALPFFRRFGRRLHAR